MGSQPMNSAPDGRRPGLADAAKAESIMLQLLDSLNRLDGVGAPLAAAYVQTAIDHLRSQFDLDGNRSETD